MFLPSFCSIGLPEREAEGRKLNVVDVENPDIITHAVMFLIAEDADALSSGRCMTV